ncbi:insulinase family protein [Streptomyces sp. COG19]|nr:insulinase family protein [Streptomyces sp. COG19]
MTTSVETRTGTGSLRRLTLDNGLRVVLDPRHMAPVVGVAVHYGIGFRGEPEGRTGFAHLFEHLMFQGSEHVGRSEHFWHVQSAGGMANASTHQDFTDYHQVVPSARARTGAVPGGGPDALPSPHRREPPHPGRGGQGGGPAECGQPSLRRLPLDRPPRPALQDLPQRPQRLRRVPRPGAGHCRGVRDVLRRPLRARQRRSHRLRQLRSRPGHRLRRTALRGHPVPGARRTRSARRTAPRGRTARRPPGWPRPAPRSGPRLPAARPGRPDRRLSGPHDPCVGARLHPRHPAATTAPGRAQPGHRSAGGLRAVRPAPGA